MWYTVKAGLHPSRQVSFPKPRPEKPEKIGKGWEKPEKVGKVWKRLGRAGKSWKRLVNTGKGVRWYIFLPGINDSTGACKYERNEKAHF